jgi:hypothetical protein
MYLQKGKATDEKIRIRSRIRIRIQVKVTDPRIRIRTKMSRIRNTAVLPQGRGHRVGAHCFCCTLSAQSPPSQAPEHRENQDSSYQDGHIYRHHCCGVGAESRGAEIKLPLGAEA